MSQKMMGVAPSGATDLVTVGYQQVHGMWVAELHVRESVIRTTGTMDAPLGVTVPAAMTLTGVYARFGTADASGSTVITIYKNGSSTGMPTITIAATGTTGSWSSTPVSFAQYDVITAGITTLGTTPGTGLAVLFTGYI